MFAARLVSQRSFQQQKQCITRKALLVTGAQLEWVIGRQQGLARHRRINSPLPKTQPILRLPAPLTLKLLQLTPTTTLAQLT
jgi:hypothetical protein